MPFPTDASPNVEIVQSAFEARNAGDIEAVIALGVPDLEFDFTRSISPYAGVYRGADDIRRLWAALLDIWADMSWEADEVIEMGDAVVVAATFRFRGRSSGAEGVAHGAHVWFMADGRITRYVQCQTREQAVAIAEGAA